MDIRELEKVVRLVSERNPAQSTLESLTPDGLLQFEMSDEFVKAVETLTGRAANVVQDSIIKEISAKWA